MDIPTRVAPYLAAGRHVVSYGAGIATAVGFMSAGASGDIIGGFDHIFKGLNEIAVGIGILAPIASAGYAAVSATIKHQVGAVKAAAPQELVQAVKQVDPVVLVNAAAETPGVARIIASPDLARVTPSAKVVAVST